MTFQRLSKDSSLWSQTSFSMTQDNSGPYDENNGEENKECQIHVSQPAVSGLLLEIKKRNIGYKVFSFLYCM